MRDVGVLGGGISGLFTAYFLGGDVEVLEADATPGGLARCFGGQGFRSDIGGHILFSKDKEALGREVAVLGDNVHQGVRANKILYGGLHVKYPFENGIDVLPKEEIVDILHSFIDNPHKALPTNFLEWMYHTFGSGLTDRYMLPYNAEDLEDTGRGDEPRVGRSRPAASAPRSRSRRPLGSRPKATRTSSTSSTRRRAASSRCLAPSQRGSERSSRPASASPSCVRATAAGRSSVTEERNDATGRSSRPCRSARSLSALGDVPAEVRSASDALRYNSLRVALVGVEATDLPAYTALYVPDPRSLYHRVCYNQVFSPDMVPPGRSSVSCEITVAPGSDLDAWSDDQILSRVVDDLVRDRIVRCESVVHREVHRERYAYVVYTHGYRQRMRTIRDSPTRGASIWPDASRNTST